MASPQKANGYVGIANEIWDEVIRRDFTKRQKDILLFIWRLSYGCRRDVAVIPMLKDFALCGVGKGHIAAELRQLEQCKVITRDGTEYRFNENYDYWQVAPVRGWDDDRFNELIHINLVEAKKTAKVTKSGTALAFKQPKESSQNGDLGEIERLPKQEPDNGCEVTETVTDKENELLKQEPTITETGTKTQPKPLGDVGYSRSKDNLQTIKITDNKNNNNSSHGLLAEPDINFGKAYQVIQKHFGLTMNAVQMDKLENYLKAGMEPELIERAAVLTREGGKDIRYMWGVLDNCNQSGIMTVAAWNEDQARRRAAPAKGGYNRNQKPALPIVPRTEVPQVSQDEMEAARRLAKMLDDGRAP